MQWEPAKVNWNGGRLQCGNQALCPLMSWLWPNAIWAHEWGSQGSVISHCYSGWRVLYNKPWAQRGEMETEAREKSRSSVMCSSKDTKLQANKLLAGRTSQAQTDYFLREPSEHSLTSESELCMVSISVCQPMLTAHFNWKWHRGLRACVYLTDKYKSIWLFVWWEEGGFCAKHTLFSFIRYFMY